MTTHTTTTAAATRPTLDERGRELLFTGARTHHAWLDRPVSEETLHRLYDLLKWPPTSANGNPARFVFLKTKEAKARLLPCLAPGNIEKTVAAPVTVIVAYDLKFYEKLPTLFPHMPAVRELFANTPELVGATARRNSSLQGAYMILAARALAWTAAPCRGSTTRSSTRSSSGRGRVARAATRSSSPRGPSSRTSSATSGTATRASCSRARRG